MDAEPLTPREAEVARLVARGRSYADIAKSLGIAPKTVERHVANAAEKIGGRAKSPKVRLILFVLNERDGD